MQYFVGFVYPGSAETNNECGGKSDGQSLDRQLCQENCYQRLLKSDNPSSSYNQKCPGCFFRDTVYDVATALIKLITRLLDEAGSTSWLDVCFFV